MERKNRKLKIEIPEFEPPASRGKASPKLSGGGMFPNMPRNQTGTFGNVPRQKGGRRFKERISMRHYIHFGFFPYPSLRLLLSVFDFIFQFSSSHASPSAHQRGSPTFTIFASSVESIP
jgi:hypothetical protein